MSAADMVFDKMKDPTERHLALGEKVPSEGVGRDVRRKPRLTVRIALQRLNALGIRILPVGDPEPIALL